MSSTVSAGDFRRDLSDIINRAHYGSERVIVARHGQPLAALISVADLEALEALEDAADVRAAHEAHLEAEADPEGGYVDWNDLRAELLAGDEADG